MSLLLGAHLSIAQNQEDANGVSDITVSSENIISKSAPTDELEVQTYQEAEPLDNDGLFEDYIDVQLQVQSASNSRKRGAKLQGVNSAIYNKLVGEISSVADGSRTSTVFEIAVEDLNLEKSEWSAEDLGIAAVEEDGVVTDEARLSITNYIGMDIGKVIRALMVDCPYELYWFDKVVGVTIVGPEFEPSDDAEQTARLVGGLTVSFAVAQGYVSEEYHVDSTNALRVQHAVEKAASVVDGAKEQCKDDYSRLSYYKDAICGLVAYDHDAMADDSFPYGDAWQIVSVFDEDDATDVVCEGYAKAFQYLCDMTDFEGDIGCITVTGNMSGGTGEGAHMWNIVAMGDGCNYLVDVTNCDEGTVGADGGLFLAGADAGTVESGYTFSCAGGNIVYTYDADTLADYDTELAITSADYEVPSEEYIEDGLVFRIADGQATLVGHEGAIADVVIPESVKGIPVTRIGGEAFCRDMSLSSVFIPATVEIIEDGVYTSLIPDQKGAFCRCKNLKSVTFAEGSRLKEVGENAFEYCVSLSEITIPESTRILGLGAFSCCYGITAINLPEGLLEVRQNALEMTSIEELSLPSTIEEFHWSNLLPKLAAYSMAKGNKRYRVSDGVLYEWMDYSVDGDGREGWVLTGYPMMKHDSVYTVPDYAEAILSMQFSESMIVEDENDVQTVEAVRNEYLETMNIGNCFIDGIGHFIYGVEVGDDNPYYTKAEGIVYSKDMKEVVRIPASLTGVISIPSGVETIGPGAAYWSELSGIILPDTLRSIEWGAFYGSQLKRIDIPDSVEELGESVFQDCEQLEYVQLPDGLKSIEFNTFFDCSKLRSVTIPESVIRLEWQSFASCGIEEITIPSNVKYFGTSTFIECHHLKRLEIPASYQGELPMRFAFGCLDLESIVVPAGVTAIGPEAFFQCDSLLEISIENTECVIDDSPETIPEEATICGYQGSTTEAYAKKNSRHFVDLERKSSIDYFEYKDPTCSEDGWYPHYSDGERFYSDSYGENPIHASDVIIPARHEYGDPIFEVRSSCESSGMKAHLECMVCGKTFIQEGDAYNEVTPAELVIPATGHQWAEDYSIENPPSCMEEGSELIRCVVCGEVKEGSERAVAKLEHVYGNWMVTKQPTCTAPGSREGECSECGGKVTEEVSALGHDYVTTVVEPACTEAGYTHHECARCGDSYRDAELPALGHSWSERYYADRYPTCTEEGVESIHCLRCDISKNGTSRPCPAQGHSWSVWETVIASTTDAPGLEFRMCSWCGLAQQRELAKLTLEPEPEPAEESDSIAILPTVVTGDISPGNPVAAAAVESQITSAKSDADPAGSTFGLLRAKGAAKSKASVKVSWTKVPGATAYVVYGNKCGKANTFKKIKTVKGASFTQKKLKADTYYKYLVVAVKGDAALATSKTIHVATKGGKAGNAKSVATAAKKGKLTLKKGKSFKLKAKAVAASKKLKVKKHRAIAYESSDPSVATVSKKGVVKAKKKGTCTVYAYAQNGVAKAVKVTVK